MHPRFVPALLAALLGAGCATSQAPDPFERVNRTVFGFNEGLDRTVLEPVATAYVEAVPSTARTALANFFSNLKDLGSAANLFLQGRPRDGASDVGRFVTNTTLGVLGFVDVATGWGMERHGEDFGKTLTHWGVEPGAYIVWPLLGPSTTRDSVAMPVDMLSNPVSAVNPASAQAGLVGTSLVGDRARALPVTRMVDAVALDKYLYVRDAYLQRHAKAPQEPAVPGGAWASTGQARLPQPTQVRDQPVASESPPSTDRSIH